MPEIKTFNNKVVTIEFTKQEIRHLNDALKNWEPFIDEARFTKHVLDSVQEAMGN